MVGLEVRMRTGRFDGDVCFFVRLDCIAMLGGGFLLIIIDVCV